MKQKVLGFSFFYLISILGAAYAAEGPEVDKKPVMTLREALTRGIENNLDIQITRVDIPVSDEEVTFQDSVFDPVLDAGVFSSEEKTPINLSTTPKDNLNINERGIVTGIGKKSRFGLSSRLSLETYRLEENTASSFLAPDYRDYLVLDLTQPLLRDFGEKINTTYLKVAQNQRKQAEFGYLNRINQIVRSIETTYYDLAKASRTLEFQIESRELARTLLEGNQKKFQAGVVPVSEVQRAETALASRDELVLLARQQVEIISDRLKDLLNIRGENPVSDKMIIPETIKIMNTDLPNMEQALGRALTHRPELKHQALEIENRDMTIAYYANQTLPRLDLSATLGINGLSGEKRNPLSPDSQYQGDYDDAFSSMTDGDGYEWKLGLTASYPWGNRAARSRRRQAEEEKGRAVYQYKRTEGVCETEVKNAWVTASRSLARVDVAERFESLAAITLDQEMKRLGQGLSDTFRILQYQDDLIDAKIRKTTAIIDFNKGISDLYYSMGDILDHHHMKVRLPGQGDLGE